MYTTLGVANSLTSPRAMATTTVTETLTNLFDVESPEHFQQLLSKDLSRVSLLNFWAPWAAPCEQMNEVVHALAQRHPNVLVLQVCKHCMQ